jgi:hypothetical protein
MEVIACGMHRAGVVHGLPALPDDLRRALIDFLRRSDRLTSNSLAHLLHPAHQRTTCTRPGLVSLVFIFHLHLPPTTRGRVGPERVHQAVAQGNQGAGRSAQSHGAQPVGHFPAASSHQYGYVVRACVRGVVCVCVWCVWCVWCAQLNRSCAIEEVAALVGLRRLCLDNSWWVRSQHPPQLYTHHTHTHTPAHRK